MKVNIDTPVSIMRSPRGAVLPLVAVLMFVLIGVSALAIDVGHLYVVHNELQNAADAGALWGAEKLYNMYGTEVNAGANQEAADAAMDNKALAGTGGAIAVEIDPDQGNEEGVQRGHWCFATKEFTPNDSLVPVDLWGVSTEELDANLNFINAVRVVAKRETIPAASFFARIFGYEDFKLSVEAVGYIGFAGTLAPEEVDLPIALCSQSLTGCACGEGGEGCEYKCNIGYMLSDGQSENTAAWTNFTQPCETASTTSLRPLLEGCRDSNPNPIELGASVGATNGVNDTIIGSPTQYNLVDCWKSALYDSNNDNIKDAPIDRDGNGWPDMPWNVNLLVVDCPGFSVSNCMESCGAVNVTILWIVEKDNDVKHDAPYKMGDWSNFNPCGNCRWDSFVTYFNLRTPDGKLATLANNGYKKKSIYFLPDCTPHELKGNTGGHNYGVLAKRPVLVK